MTQEIDKLEPAPSKPTLEMVLAERKNKILEMGGFGIKEVERFISVALTSVATNEKLQKCSLDSIVMAVYDAARCGLAPNSITQEGHLVPYYSSKKKCYECKFITGYRGVINMIYATGTVSMVDVTEVFEHDDFFEKKGSHPDVHHIPKNDGPRGEFIGAYAVITDKDTGRPKHHYCSKWDGEQHRDRYGPKNKKGDIVGPWITNFPAMVMKTSLKKVSKYCPTSPATQRLFAMIRREEMEERPPTHTEHPEIKTPQELDAPVMVDPDTGEVIPDEIVKDEDAGKDKELFD